MSKWIPVLKCFQGHHVLLWCVQAENEYMHGISFWMITLKTKSFFTFHQTLKLCPVKLTADLEKLNHSSDIIIFDIWVNYPVVLDWSDTSVKHLPTALITHLRTSDIWISSKYYRCTIILCRNEISPCNSVLHLPLRRGVDPLEF